MRLYGAPASNLTSENRSWPKLLPDGTPEGISRSEWSGSRGRAAAALFQAFLLAGSLVWAVPGHAGADKPVQQAGSEAASSGDAACAGDAKSASPNCFKTVFNPKALGLRSSIGPDGDGAGKDFGFSPAPPPMIGMLLIEQASADVALVGAASMYNPFSQNDYEPGGPQTASGELYDASSWTAAIQIGLREQFGGVRYGKNYQPAFALVESGGRRAIVKINDVGPLRPGRIIDFNEQTMSYFDPTMQRGVIDGVKVTPLAGGGWTPGPVEGQRMMSIAAQFD